MVRLEDTEKRHNTHMVRTIRVCPYRTRVVRKIVPYAYGTKYAYGIEHPHTTAAIFMSDVILDKAQSSPNSALSITLFHCMHVIVACLHCTVVRVSLVFADPFSGVALIN